MESSDRPVVDDTDRRIIGRLESNGRISIRALADEVSLSTSATSERVKRLEQSGAIVGYRAVVDPRISGRTLEATVGVVARGDTDRRVLEQWFTEQEAIVEAVHLTGADDYLLRLECRDTDELDRLVMSMKSDAHVAETDTRIILRSIDLDPLPPDE